MVKTTKQYIFRVISFQAVIPCHPPWWFSEALSWSSEHILVVDCDPIFGGFF
jgi:hypothetical protein